MIGSTPIRIALATALLCVSIVASAEVKKHIMAGAGPDQRVEEGNKVVLAGSGRVDSGRIVRFGWQQIKGPRVNLNKAHRSTADFKAPRVTASTPLVFQLTVTDTHGHVAKENVTVTVLPKNQGRQAPETVAAEPQDAPGETGAPKSRKRLD